MIRLDNAESVSEIKVVTYIDLLTQVAGIPSFLFMICKFLMKNFEIFYSDLRMAECFQDKGNGPPPSSKGDKKNNNDEKEFAFHK